MENKNYTESLDKYVSLKESNDRPYKSQYMVNGDVETIDFDTVDLNQGNIYNQNYGKEMEAMANGYGHQQYQKYLNQNFTPEESARLAQIDVNAALKNGGTQMNAQKNTMTAEQVLSTPYDQLPEDVKKNYGHYVEAYNTAKGIDQQKINAFEQNYTPTGTGADQAHYEQLAAMKNDFNNKYGTASSVQTSPTPSFPTGVNVNYTPNHVERPTITLPIEQINKMTPEQILTTPYEQLPEGVKKNYGSYMEAYNMAKGTAQQKINAFEQNYTPTGTGADQAHYEQLEAMKKDFNDRYGNI